MGVIAASDPPAIITSASPRLMISAASPTACAEAVQAVHVARFGPRAPNRIDTCPAARLMMDAGMKTRNAARAAAQQFLVLLLDRRESADAGAMKTPTLSALAEASPRAAHHRRQIATRRARTG
jgi:hypothetical protein